MCPRCLASWRLWCDFCHTLAIDPHHLPADPIPILQVFAQRLRSGALAPSRRPVRSRTVEDIVRAVGQTYASVGAPDPRMNTHGTLDFRLTTLYQAWTRLDDPPSRVKPLPVSLLTQAVTIVKQDAHPFAQATADCLVFGFYFLLRPGEYLGLPDDALDTLFRIRDVQCWIGSRALDTFECSIGRGTSSLHVRYAHLHPPKEWRAERNDRTWPFRPRLSLSCPQHCGAPCGTPPQQCSPFHAPQCLWQRFLPAVRPSSRCHPHPARCPCVVPRSRLPPVLHLRPVHPRRRGHGSALRRRR